MDKKTNGLPLYLDGMLSEKFLELHEACFIFSGEWPNNMIAASIPEYLQEPHERGVVYFVEGGINQKALNRKTHEMLKHMKLAIKNRELIAYPIILGFENRYHNQDCSYFLKTSDIIMWTLNNDYYLPAEIQTKLNVYQQKINYASKPKQNTVKNKFLGQFINSICSKLSIDEIRDHPLMEEFGAKSSDNSRRAIYRDLLEVFNLPKGKRGAKTYVTQSIMPIQEVLMKDVKGNSRYSFASLKTILIIATKVKIKVIGLENFMKLTGGEFLKLVFSDEILSLYLKDANEFVLRFSMLVFLNELEEKYSHNKIKAIPWEQKKSMNIGTLMGLNWDYCHKRFTDEEKEKHGICKSDCFNQNNIEFLKK
jgi:hypothetical protein